MLELLAVSVLLLQGTGAQRPRAPGGNAGAVEEKLKTRIGNYDTASDSFVDALLKVAGEYKVPMGVEWVRTASSARPVRISKKDVSLRQIIESLVGTQPGYRVTVREGVLHVSPPSGSLPDRENFLKLGVASFQTRNQVVELADRQLGDLVSTKMWAPEKSGGGRTLGGVGHSLGVEVGDPEITVTLRDTTVEGVLDALLLASERGVWLATFGPPGELTPSGYRRTVSPVTGEAPSRPSGPHWEILRWGRHPY